MTLGNQLREARRLKGLTQTQVAERVGIDQSTISKVEGGDPSRMTSKRSRDTLIRWAGVVGLDPQRALELAGHEPRSDVVRTRPPLEDFIRTEPTLTVEDRSFLLEVVRRLRGKG